MFHMCVSVYVGAEMQSYVYWFISSSLENRRHSSTARIHARDMGVCEPGLCIKETDPHTHTHDIAVWSAVPVCSRMCAFIMCVHATRTPPHDCYRGRRRAPRRLPGLNALDNARALVAYTRVINWYAHADYTLQTYIHITQIWYSCDAVCVVVAYGPEYQRGRDFVASRHIHAVDPEIILYIRTVVYTIDI